MPTLTYAGFAVGRQFEVGRTNAPDGVPELIGGGAKIRATAAHDGRYDVHGSGTIMTSRVHGPVEDFLVFG